MAFDSSLILRDGLVDLDNSEAVSTSLTRNGDGAVALDVKKVGAQGMTAVCIVDAAATTFADTMDIAIQESENLDRNWRTIGDIEQVPALIYRLRDCTATTAFVAADVTTPRVLTATTGGDTGKVYKVDQALFTVGGVGDIFIIQVDVNDTYATAGDILTATSGTGIATQGPIGEAWHKKVMMIRFTTTQRYLRGLYTASAGSNYKKLFVFLTNHSYGSS